MNFKIEGVTKKFGDQVVLNNISLAVKDIHSLTLIGPSGGGKTTLLRMLAGAEFIDSGKVLMNDHSVHLRGQNLKVYRKNIEVVFQNHNLFPHLSAIENITLPLIKVHHLTKKEAQERAYVLLKRFKMLGHVNKRPLELSGGQQQRVAICRAVAANPEILFLDEPTSALDPEQTAEVLELIEELKEDKIDMVLVTHEMGFARRVSDHILFISNQSILVEGTPETVFSKDNPREVIDFLSKVLHYN